MTRANWISLVAFLLWLSLLLPWRSEAYVFSFEGAESVMGSSEVVHAMGTKPGAFVYIAALLGFLFAVARKRTVVGVLSVVVLLLAGWAFTESRPSEASYSFELHMQFGFWISFLLALVLSFLSFSPSRR